MVHNCHHNYKLFTAKPNSSRQNQKARGKTKRLTAKEKKLTAKPIAHGKTRKGRSWTLTVLAMVVEKKQDMVALFSNLVVVDYDVLFKLRSGGCLRSELLHEMWSRYCIVVPLYIKFFNLKIRLLNHRYKRVRSISTENMGLSSKDWTMYGTVTFPRLFLVQETRCVISVLA